MSSYNIWRALKLIVLFSEIDLLLVIREKYVKTHSV